jgi:hypothetical protein
MSDRLDDQNDLKMGGTTDVSRVIRMSDRLDDQNLGVSRVIRNCVRRDLMTDGNLDVNRDHHMNVMDDRNDLMMVVSLDVSRGHRMSDLLVDQNLDVMMDGNLYRHTNVMDDRNDLTMVVSLDVSRGHRMSDLLVDHLMDVDHHDVLVGHRMNDLLDDLNLDVTMDVSRDLRMNDQLDDHLMDGKMSHRVDLSIDPECYVLVGHRMNVKDDRKTDGNHVSRNYVLPDQKTGGNLDASRVNRNCVRRDLNLDANLLNRSYAPRDRKMDVNLDAMSHHVMLMGDQSKSCDRMSHDHLQCDHRMMRRHDTSRNLVVMILDVNHPKTDDPMHLRRVNRRMKVCPKMDDRKMI